MAQTLRRARSTGSIPDYPRGDFGKAKAPRRAVLYARVSTRGDNQDPKTQLAALRTWAAQRGWDVVAEEVDRVTGDPRRRKGEPAGLQGALRALAERRADVLCVFAADRLVRSPMHLLELVGRVQSLGAHVASMQDGADLDTTSDMGELYLFLRGWMARMELKLTRSRIMAGLSRAKAEGKSLGRPRMGDVDGADVLRMRADDKSWSEVAASLGCTVSTARRRAAETRTAPSTTAPKRGRVS